MKKLLLMLVMLLLVVNSAHAYIQEVDHELTIKYLDGYRIELVNDDGDDETFQCTNTSKSSDTWDFSFYKNFSTSDVCPDATELQEEIKSSYQAMLDICAQTQTLYADEKERAQQLTDCRVQLTEESTLRERYLEESNSKTSSVTEMKAELDAKKTALETCETDKAGLMGDAQRVNTLSRDNVELEKSVEDLKKSGTTKIIIGIGVGLLAFYMYSKYGDKISGEGPSDEGGF